MATGNEAQAIYQQRLKEGYTPKDAAKDAQKRTGFSLVTNKPIKPKSLKFSKRGVSYGDNVQFKSSRSNEPQGVPRQFG